MIHFIITLILAGYLFICIQDRVVSPSALIIGLVLVLDLYHAPGKEYWWIGVRVIFALLYVRRFLATLIDAVSVSINVHVDETLMKALYEKEKIVTKEFYEVEDDS